MEIPNSVRYFQKLNEMVKELASEMKGEKMKLYTANVIKDQVHKLLCKDCEETDVCPVCDYRELIDEILNAPTVDPIKHGRWINHISENGATDGTYCSICDYEIDRDARYNYCPNCGAKMDEKYER